MTPPKPHDLSSLVVDCPDVLAVTDSAARLIFLSPRIRQLIGRSPEELVGTPFPELLHPDDRESFEAIFAAALGKSTVAVEFCRLRASTGGWVMTEVAVASRTAPSPSGPREMVLAIRPQTKGAVLGGRTLPLDALWMIWENLPVALFRSSPDGTVRAINPALVRLYGHTSEVDLMALHPASVFDSAAARQEMIDDLNAHGEIEGREFLVRRKDGSRFWVSTTIRAVKDKAGRIRYFDGVDIDITDRKRAEQALRESEDRYRTAYQAIPIPMFTFRLSEPDLVLADYNLAAVQLWGASLTQLIGKRVDQVLVGNSPLCDDLRRCLRECPTIRGEYLHTFEAAKGERRLRCSCSSVPPDSVVLHAEDVTESHAAGEALRLKTVALGEVLGQIEAERQAVQASVTANLERAVFPTLRALQARLSPADRRVLHQLEQELTDLVSPLVGALEEEYSSLTLRELEICRMISNGLSSKEMAERLTISIETVHKFRHAIRKKLGITHSEVNLAAYLRQLDHRKSEGT